MTKRLNNKNLIKKILASLVIFITTTLFLLWYAYAADWEYDYNRHITINLNGGSAGEMPIRYQVDYTGEGHTAGDWLDKDATPIGQKFIDKHGNSHTVADLRAPDRFGTPITTSVSEGTNYQRMDFVGTTPYIFIKNPTRAGYTFAGWELNFTNSTPSSYPPGYSPSDGYTAFNIGAWTRNSDNDSYLTITATWTANAPSTYTMNITYDSGVASVSGAGTYNCNSIATIGATPKPGYSIAYAKDLDSGAVWYGNDMWDWTMYANRHIYFATTPNTYTVTYDANGGTGAPAAQNFKYNSGERISTIKPTRSGYAFVNWAYGSTRFNPGDAIPSGWGSFTLTAQWKFNGYKLEFDANGGTGSVPSAITFTSSTDSHDITSTVPTRTGYVFRGWSASSSYSNKRVAYTSNCGGSADSNGVSAKITNSSWTISDYATNTGGTTPSVGGTLKLYAQWAPINQISHWAWGLKNGEGNNGNGSAFHIGSTSFEATPGSTYTMNLSKAISIPNGFYLYNFGSSSINGSWQGYPIPTDVTQSAGGMHYEYNYYPKEYTISYSLNGGTNDSNNPSSYNVLYEVALKNPTRTGYTFKGWYSNLFNISEPYSTWGARASGVTISGNNVVFKNYSNGSDGNPFTAVSVDIYHGPGNFPISLNVLTKNSAGSIIGEYTHTESTGYYKAVLKTGDADACTVTYNVQRRQTLFFIQSMG